MKLHDVIARVRAGHFEVQTVSDEALLAIVERTLLAVGLHIASDGEVYDPAPRPPKVELPNVPTMNRVRYSGRGRRR